MKTKYVFSNAHRRLINVFMCFFISVMMILSGFMPSLIVYAEDEADDAQILTEVAEEENVADSSERAEASDALEEAENITQDNAAQVNATQDNEAQDNAATDNAGTEAQDNAATDNVGTEAQENVSAEIQEEDSDETADNASVATPEETTSNEESTEEDAAAESADKSSDEKPEDSADDKIEDPAAVIAGKGYATLQEAIDAASDGDVIEVQKDLKENVEIKSRNQDKVLTIDLGGHTISPANAEDMVIYVNGGSDITIKNGKVTGYDSANGALGAVHLLADKATIDKVEFVNNKGTALSAHYAVIMIDGRHFEKREITVSNCSFNGNGKPAEDFTMSPVYITGYSASFDNCVLWDNVGGITLFSQTPDNDISVDYSIRNSRICKSKGKALDVGIPEHGLLTMYNTYINDNDANGEDALIDFHPVDSAGEEAGCAILSWCKVYNNTGAKHTINHDARTSITLSGSTIENNTAENTGAVYSNRGYIIMQNYAVIRNNTATGSGKRVSGGISACSSVSVVYKGTPGEGGGYSDPVADGASFIMYDGAIYDNKAPNAQFEGIDVYVAPKCLVIAPSPKTFKGYDGINEVDKDLSECKWVEQSGDYADDTLDGGSPDEMILKVAPYTSSPEVYLDGVNGNDDNDGLTAETAVRTFAKAKEIAIASDEVKYINLVGRVKVDDDQTWTLPEGKVLRRHDSYLGTGVMVTGSLTLDDIIVDGNSRGGVSGANTLFDVRGNLTMEDGAEIRNNSSIVVELSYGGNFDMLGGAIRNTNVPDKYDTAAVVVKRNSTFNMSGGVLENNVSRRASTSSANDQTIRTDQTYSGGAVYVGGAATANISGDAVLQNNRADMGGAIYMDFNSNVNISEGKFANNHADKMGGAIVVAANNANLMITGGLFDGNVSEDTGGAIWSWGSETYIYGGKFINNEATRYGGAIAIAEDKDAYIHLKNAIIRNNSASIMGGGIWVCPVGSIQFDAKEGIVMYDNTADKAADDFAAAPTIYNFFSASRAFRVYLSETVLAGERASFYEDGRVTYGGAYGAVDTSAPRFDVDNPGEKLTVYGETGTGLAIKSIISDSSKEIYDEMSANAEEGAVVLFENNSAWRGGAIGGNSNVINTEERVKPKDGELRVTKKWADDIAEEEIPDSITVSLMLDDRAIDSITLTGDSEWQGRFRGLIAEYLEAGRYSVTEKEIEGYVARYSEVTKSEEEGEELIWNVTIENSKKPEEPPEEEEEPPAEEEEPPAEEEEPPVEEEEPPTDEEEEPPKEEEEPPAVEEEYKPPTDENDEVKGVYEKKVVEKVKEVREVKSAHKTEVRSVETGDYSTVYAAMLAAVMTVAAALIVIMLKRRKAQRNE